MLVFQKQYSCRSCHKRFADEKRLEKHLSRAHGSEEFRTIQCKVCDKRFLTSAALGSHVRTHSGQGSLWECSICKESYHTREGLTEHVASHAINGNYACPSCQKVFSSYLNTRKHIMKVHRSSGVQCTLCDCSYSSKEKYENHMSRHSHQQKQFACEHCEKVFKRGYKLRQHIQQHHCGASSDETLIVHRETKKTMEANESTKNIEKKLQDLNAKYVFKCGPCLLGFKRRGMLVNHIAKFHPEIKPDEIPELNLPIMMTFRDFYCHLCEKVYRSNAKRKAHIMKFHPGVPKGEQLKRSPSFDQLAGTIATKPEHCPWCHKQYATNAKLLQHVRSQHSDKSHAGIRKRGRKQTSGCTNKSEAEDTETSKSQVVIVKSYSDGFNSEGSSIDSCGFESSLCEAEDHKIYRSAEDESEMQLDMVTKDKAVCVPIYNINVPSAGEIFEDKFAEGTLYSELQLTDIEMMAPESASMSGISLSIGDNHDCITDWLIDIQVRSMPPIEHRALEGLETDCEGNYKIEGLPSMVDDENSTESNHHMFDLNFNPKPTQLPPFQVIYSPYPPH